jgi:hypothetical protein
MPCGSWPLRKHSENSIRLAGTAARRTTPRSMRSTSGMSGAWSLRGNTRSACVGVSKPRRPWSTASCDVVNRGVAFQ